MTTRFRMPGLVSLGALIMLPLAINGQCNRKGAAEGDAATATPSPTEEVREAETKGTFVVRIFQNATLVRDSTNYADQGYSIVAGKAWVLDMRRDNGGDETTDRQFRDRIWLELPAAGPQVISDGGLRDAGAIYGQFCRCVDGGWQPVDSGSVRITAAGNGAYKVVVDAHPLGKNSGERHSYQGSGMATPELVATKKR